VISYAHVLDYTKILLWQFRQYEVILILTFSKEFPSSIYYRGMWEFRKKYFQSDSVSLSSVDIIIVWSN